MAREGESARGDLIAQESVFAQVEEFARGGVFALEKARGGRRI